MQKTLCLDFGNTRYKGGLFENGEFVTEYILSDGSVEEIASLLDNLKPHRVVLSSVVFHDPAIETFIAERVLFHKITHLSNLSISLPSGKMETVGADRWAMLEEAERRYPHQHSLIIGLGSCITFNFLDRFAHFLGGSISPGLYMRFKAMNDFTAQLPLVAPDWNFPLVGYDTRTNLLSGVILGMSKEIDGIIEAYKQRYDHLNVLMTGGDMSFFLPHLHNQVEADPYLIYKGMYAIGEASFAGSSLKR